jgi:hypothetical protein
MWVSAKSPDTRRHRYPNRTGNLPPKELPLRVRIGSTIVVVAAAIGLVTSVAGPIYSAQGASSSSSATTNGRIMR